MKYYTSEEAATIITDDLPLPNYADTDDESSESDDDDVETFRIPSPLDEMEELVLPEQIVDEDEFINISHPCGHLKKYKIGNFGIKSC